MMITAGNLDHRIQFQRATVVDDGLTETLVFAAHGDAVWGSRKDISDGERWNGERWQAGALHAQVTTRFVVRWSAFAAGITPKDRLDCGEMGYEIVGIKVIGRRKLIEITANARIDI